MAGRRARSGPVDGSPPVGGGGPVGPGAVVYREALRVPVWWYPVGLVVASLLAGEFHLSGIALSDWLAFGILLPLSVLLVWSFGHGRLELVAGPDATLATGELRVRGAHVPLADVSGVVGLDRPTLRLVVGREGDPAAFVSIRPWIGTGVQLWLDDPDDPTPYWVVSTRRPRELVALVRAAI